MKRLLILATALVLAACGSDAPQDSVGEDARPSAGDTGAPPEDTRDRAAESDAAQLDELCDQYCEPLIAQEFVCPTGTTNLVSCMMPLAQGSDLVNDLADATAGLDRSDPERYETLDQRIVEARDAYDTWSDHSVCSMITDTAAPFYTQMHGAQEVQICALEATTASYTQASVGGVLRQLSRG